ncbi:hypothetical protein Q1695_016384 [Nippostrongylus brasiliensis]|nr:hypothetical protein Q1695_016384 [Nippostrongylus brasiliensis]
MLIWLEGSDQQVDRLGVDVPMVKMIAMGIDPIGSVGFMKTSELDERQHKYTRSAWELPEPLLLNPRRKGDLLLPVRQVNLVMPTKSRGIGKRSHSASPWNFRQGQWN